MSRVLIDNGPCNAKGPTCDSGLLLGDRSLSWGQTDELHVLMPQTSDVPYAERSRMRNTGALFEFGDRLHVWSAPFSPRICA